MADTTPKKSKKAAQKPEKVASQGISEPSQTQEAAPPKKKTGRPSKYTPEIAKQICEQLSDGIPLREICKQEGFPAWQTVYDWMYRDEGLSRAIAHARDLGYDAIAEDCLMIADNMLMGEEVTESRDDKGKVTISTKTVDLLGHRRFQVYTRLKLLAKFNPKKYGDKVQVGGDPENPLAVTADVALFDKILDGLEAKRQMKNAG